jgi:dTDP-4-dehydrorhamnose reductase
VYSRSKLAAEQRIRACPNALILRLRMPVTDTREERNFVTKLAGYARLIDVPNSVSVLGDLLPVSLDMARRALTGVYNFTNPGAVSHRDIMQMYQAIVDNTKVRCGECTIPSHPRGSDGALYWPMAHRNLSTLRRTTPRRSA